MHSRYLPAIAFLMFVAGCASTPTAADISAVTASPGQFKNRYIEITAPVLENSPPQGDVYRTWAFSIGASSAYRILATEEGYNPATIEKAYRLVEEARNAGDAVTVTGTLRVGPYRELESGVELELVSVRYGSTEINTDRGPFGRRDYHPYHGSLFLHFGHHDRHHRW